MEYFKSRLKKIGINPFVFLHEEVLLEIFKDANKTKGAIPVRGQVNQKQFKQTLLRFKGEWRLYINTVMLDNSPGRIGEELEISIEFDPEPRHILAHPKLIAALESNSDAKAVFDKLPASRRKEIIQYISYLKTEERIEANIQKAIGYLMGKNRFVGRDRP